MCIAYYLKVLNDFLRESNMLANMLRILYRETDNDYFMKMADIEALMSK